jgi:hypothetical protein
MKKLFGMLVLLTLIYFLYQAIFVFFQGGHDMKYSLLDGDKVINVREILKAGNRYSNEDFYSFKIDVDNISFDVQINHNFGRSSDVITDIKYYKDDKCIFIKYRDNKTLTDILCLNNNVIIPYHNLSSVSEGLKIFANSMGKFGYDEKKWADNLDDGKNIENSNFYNKNLIKNHYIGISIPGGLFHINNIDQIKANKVYTSVNNNQPLLKAFLNNKYVIANYDDKEIYRFHVLDINSNSIDLFSGKTISINSYVIGVHDTSVYLYDPDAKKEYELDYAVKRVLEVGNEDTGIVYYQDGKWKRTALNDDLSSLYFINDYSTDYSNPKYDKTIKIGTKYGYYYYIKNSNSEYKVYRSSTYNKEIVTYLFTTTNIQNLVFIDNYVYYIDNGSLKYYNDETGSKTIVYNPGLLNDKNVSIGIYIQK